MKKERLQELAGIQLNESSNEDNIFNQLEHDVQQAVKRLADLWDGDVEGAAEAVQERLNHMPLA